MLAALAAGPVASVAVPEDEAQTAADAWLALVDKGSYGDSWEQAATVFKTAVRKDDWNRAVATARGPLGKVISRKLKSRRYTERLPGAPDGKYVVIQYDTVFEQKSSAIETITPMADSDGTWRVSGYFVR
jgi:hypothetical protein